MTNDKIKICQTCGEENSSENKYCISCGTLLNKDGKIIAVEKEIYTEEKSSGKKSKYNKLSNMRIGYFIFALVIVGAFILTASGTFDIPNVASNVRNVQNQANSQRGVDLGMMNQINELQQKIDNNPNDFQSLLKQGHLFSDSRLFEKAIENYDVYLKNFPNEVDVIVDKGYCLFELKKYDEAIKVFKSGLAINPNHQIGTFNTGIVYLSMGNDLEAKNYFKKASEIDPNSEIGKKAIDLLKSH